MKGEASDPGILTVGTMRTRLKLELELRSKMELIELRMGSKMEPKLKLGQTSWMMLKKSVSLFHTPARPTHSRIPSF
jgi:hypothetical protein